jgi:hypothetical protein
MYLLLLVRDTYCARNNNFLVDTMREKIPSMLLNHLSLLKIEMVNISLGKRFF